MFTSRTNWRFEPNLLAQAVERHRHSGRVLLDLTVSNPTTCGFAYPQQEILAALADPRALTYSPESKGLPEARAAVAELLPQSRGICRCGASCARGVRRN